jgi:hypothetical protein
MNKKESANFYCWEYKCAPLCLKGSVQRKLKWVENGVKRSVGASDCGDGHSFVVLFGFHLGFAIFPFPISTVKIIGEFCITGEAVRVT